MRTVHAPQSPLSHPCLDPIRVARLDARPIAKKSIEAQEMHERSEKLTAG